MDQGYKHFSHLHNLVVHQMPEGIEFSCSCCNSSGTGITYVCWQCNFFVHEQCFKAARSLKHPSHPPHPLTLVPYPTYPSNSFYCNSCQIIGTGFAYSCADCEFDLHVQCAYSNMASVPSSHAHNIPYTHPYSIPDVQYHSTPHAHPNPSPTPQIPSMSHSIPCVSIPTSSQNHIPMSIPHPIAQNGLEEEAIVHFSHPHNLSVVNLKENEVLCSGCEDIIVGKGYSCSQPNCNFHLHESCFHLKKQIQHKSHPEHPLNLLPFAPYKNKNREFTCNACFGEGRGFTYHCSICKFDLHIQCASLPETVKRADHNHVLKLFYSCPVKDDDYRFGCDVCHQEVRKDHWVYYCEPCDFGTDLGCVDREKRERDSVLDTQVQLQKLQLEMQMNQQLAQMIAGMGARISGLIG